MGMHDVVTFYSKNGISDQVIDFYIRYRAVYCALLSIFIVSGIDVVCTCNSYTT